jgi:hypothetical protein
MSDTTSWPDPDRPGVPLNPERDGWHWLGHPGTTCRRPFGWDAIHQAWHNYGLNKPDAMARFGYYYICPCLTPSEVAAREAAAAQEMMAKCRAAVNWSATLEDESPEWWRGHECGIAWALARLAALPLPAPDALARALADAERRGMERERARYADLITALAGLMRGEDWNHGTHAQRYGYRAAVMRAYAEICAPAEGETP